MSASSAKSAVTIFSRLRLPTASFLAAHRLVAVGIAEPRHPRGVADERLAGLESARTELALERDRVFALEAEEHALPEYAFGAASAVAVLYELLQHERRAPARQPAPAHATLWLPLQLDAEAEAVEVAGLGESSPLRHLSTRLGRNKIEPDSYPC